MKRPWNIVNVPIYSLATYKDGKVNMNICTYVSGLSMKPKQYMIGVYYGTETYNRLISGSDIVLQILHQQHIGLIKRLGKSSGAQKDKHRWLHQNDWLDSWQNLTVLKEACAYLKLKQVKRLNTGGDHELFIFEVEKSKTISENKVLMFQDLVQQGIIL